MSDHPTVCPDIPEEGPRISAGLCIYTRDDPRYWSRRRPSDHNHQGLFKHGPRGEQVGWLRDIKVGEANCAPSHETREAALQRMSETTRRKLRLLAELLVRRSKPATSGRKKRAA